MQRPRFARPKRVELLNPRRGNGRVDADWCDDMCVLCDGPNELRQVGQKPLDLVQARLRTRIRD